MGSRCLRCRVRECSAEAGLDKYDWWMATENVFILLMAGRLLNDGLGEPPPPVREVAKTLRIRSVLSRYRKWDDFTALVEMVDRAREKRNGRQSNTES
jgi:hypothetical protein